MSQAFVSMVSPTEVARLAGVKPATVSNWRKRHADFPASIGGSLSRPLFSKADVLAWLLSRGEIKEPETGSVAQAVEAMSSIFESSAPKIRIFSIETTLMALAAWEAKSRAGSLPKEARLQAFSLEEGPLARDAWDGESLSEFTAFENAFGDEEDKTPVAATPAELRNWELLRMVLLTVGSLEPILTQNEKPIFGSGALLRAAAKILLTVDDLAEFAERVDARLKERAISVIHLHNGQSEVALAVNDAAELAPFIDSSERSVADPANGATFSKNIMTAQLADVMVGLLPTWTRKLASLASGTGEVVRAAHSKGLSVEAAWDFDSIANTYLYARSVTLGLTVVPELVDLLRPSPLQGEFEAAICDPVLGPSDGLKVADGTRFAFGVTTHSSEWLWPQVVLEVLAEGGVGVVMMSLSEWSATRHAARRIKERLISAGHIEAVIEFPKNTYPGVQVATVAIVLSKTPRHDKEILFVDANRDPNEGFSGAVAALEAWRSGAVPAREWVKAIRPLLLVTEYLEAQPSTITKVGADIHLDVLADRSKHLRHELSVLGGSLSHPTVKVFSELEESAGVVEKDPALMGREISELGIKISSTRNWTAAKHDDLKRVEVITAADLGYPLRSVEVPATHKLALASAGDVLVPEVSVGVPKAIVWRGEPTQVGAGVFVLRVPEGKIDPDFLVQALLSESNQLIASRSTVVSRINPKKFRVPMLSLERQRAIGSAVRELKAVELRARDLLQASQELNQLLSVGLEAGVFQK